MQPSSRILSRVFPFLIALLALSIQPVPLDARADEPGGFHWKSVDGAQVKLDDKVPLAWNVYQLDKKKLQNLALVLIGRRYILLDDKAKIAYLVLPTDLHAQGQDFDSGDLAVQSRVIPSTEWNVHDVGPAEEIRLTLEDYGRDLSVQLPHPIDLRLGIY